MKFINLSFGLVNPSLNNSPTEEFEIRKTKRNILKILKFSLPACKYPLSCRRINKTPQLNKAPLEEFEICSTKRDTLKILKVSLPACTYPFILNPSGRGLLIQSLPDMMYPPGRPNPKGGGGYYSEASKLHGGFTNPKCGLC